MRVPMISMAVATALLVGFAAQAATPAEQELINIEAQWSKAGVDHDIAAVDRIVAADWTGQDKSGKVTHKADILADMKSGKAKSTAVTNRDLSVRILGDVAVVQGSDDEKSMYDGVDTSGAYTWTDVFQKRGGHWVVFASQVTPVSPKKK
ncbi:MAG: nuclear transport factor 2 family protein [Phenylobacterium sp.]